MLPRDVSLDLLALMDSCFEDDEEAVEARIANLTRVEAEEVLDAAVYELVQAHGHAFKLEKAGAETLDQIVVRSPLYENQKFPELLSLTESWMTGEREAVRERIARMTENEIREVLEYAVHELMLAIKRVFDVKEALGTLDELS